MILGFTGTSAGMTDLQMTTVASLVDAVKPTLAVHGDCIGADTEFHVICQCLAVPIRLRPCDHYMRSHNELATEVMPVRKPLERNKDIVGDCDLLIAVSYGPAEDRRSGTWHTVRCARKSRKPILVVWPDGSVTREGQALVDLTACNVTERGA